MSEVVQAWPAASGARFEANGLDEASEHVMDAQGEQAGAVARDEERVAPRGRAEPVTQLGVVVQRGQCAGMQRQFAALAELAIDDAQELMAIVDVDVVAVDYALASTVIPALFSYVGTV